MTDIHKNFFGQMPTMKKLINGSVYRRLEIGEIIQEGDQWEMKSPKYADTEWFMVAKEMQEKGNKIIGQKYNPNHEHRYLIIWRKLDVGR